MYVMQASPFLLSLGVKALVRPVKNDNSGLHNYTGLIGTSVSGTFLLIIAVINLIILAGILKGVPRHAPRRLRLWRNPKINRFANSLDAAEVARHDWRRGQTRTLLMTAWLFLLAAIAAEVVGTLQLRELADGFHPVPAAIVVVAYVASFALMIPALKTINVGVSYAVWSAVGTAAVAGLGSLFFHERLNAAGIAGIVVIVLGVVLLTASGSTTH